MKVVKYNEREFRGGGESLQGHGLQGHVLFARLAAEEGIHRQRYSLGVFYKRKAFVPYWRKGCVYHACIFSIGGRHAYIR